MVNINLDLQLQQQYIVIINLDLQWQQQYMVNINLDLQLEQQYMVNINLDFAVAATIHGQYQPRPTVHYEPTSVHKTKKAISPKLPQMG